MDKPQYKSIWPVGQLTIALAALTAVPAHADFYGPIEVLADTGELKVEYSSKVLHDQAMLNVQNLEEEDLKCSAEFSNGPELIIKRVGFVSAGREILFTAPLRRTVVKLVVDLSCQRLE